MNTASPCPLGPDSRPVCTQVWAANLSASTAAGCSAVSVPAGPIGGLGGAARFSEGLAIWGSALDTRSSAPAVVQVGVDGATVGWLRVDKSRPDIGAVWPRWGSNRGWSTVHAGAPVREVCAWVSDASVTVRAPIGCVPGG